MKLDFTNSFKRKTKKLFKKDPQIRFEFNKQFSFFQKNQEHPSLKLHKLKGRRSGQYAIWIRGDLRALGIKDGNKFIFFDLVKHDKY